MIAQLKLGHTLVLERQHKSAEGHLLAGYEVLAKQPDPSAPRLKGARADLGRFTTHCTSPRRPASFGRIVRPARVRAAGPGLNFIHASPILYTAQHSACAGRKGLAHTATLAPAVPLSL